MGVSFVQPHEQTQFHEQISLESLIGPITLIHHEMNAIYKSVHVIWKQFYLHIININSMVS